MSVMDETDISILRFGRGKPNKTDKIDTSGTAKNLNQLDKDTKLPIDSRATDDDLYNTNNVNVGVALIFNHKRVRGQNPRIGTEKDRDRLKQSLTLYGFDVRIFEDLSFARLVEELNSVAKQDHSQNDCLVVVVLSHGVEDKIYASDMSYPTERLWQPFLGENSKSLINKPKLFFIQACRGENVEKAVVFRTMSRSMHPSYANVSPSRAATYAIPNSADLLIMYSTFDKHYSFRNPENGSWFIQSLCSVLEDTAVEIMSSSEGAELLQLLTAVNRKVAYEYQSHTNNAKLNERKEMPNFLSTLTKTFYLKMKNKN